MILLCMSKGKMGKLDRRKAGYLISSNAWSLVEFPLFRFVKFVVFLVGRACLCVIGKVPQAALSKES